MKQTKKAKLSEDTIESYEQMLTKMILENDDVFVFARRLKEFVDNQKAQAQQEAVEDFKKTIAFRHLEIAEENLKIYRGMEEMSIEHSKALIKILKTLQKEQE